MAVCIAVINAQNTPLYIRTIDNIDPLSYHYKVYGALDVIKSKISPSSKNSASLDQYLGVLVPSGDDRIYGYVTCTDVKFVIVQAAQQNEHDILPSFKVIHQAYLHLALNPFYDLGAQINTEDTKNLAYPAYKRFDETISSLLKSGLSQQGPINAKHKARESLIV